jgi:hypothetical protein
MHFQNRFDNNWAEIYLNLPTVIAFSQFVKEVVAAGGVGIIGGDHFVGKTCLVGDLVREEVWMELYNLPPQMTVAEFYDGLEHGFECFSRPTDKLLGDQRAELIVNLNLCANNGSTPAMFFDNASFLSSQMMDELSYLYDRAEHCAIFLIDKQGLNLFGVSSRLKSAWTSFTVDRLSTYEYLDLLRAISALFPEEGGLEFLLAAMDDRDNAWHNAQCGLWGGFKGDPKFKFRDCPTIGEFAKGVSKLLQIADSSNLARPMLLEYFVPSWLETSVDGE